MSSLCVGVAAILVVCVYFLSSAHAAFVIDGNGMREVNMTEILERARLNRPNIAAQRAPSSCIRGDVVVRVGYTWKERCRECICTETGISCTGPQCALPYEPMQEVTCAKFADECCCEQLGCLLDDGTNIPIGQPMPLDPSRPCEACTCRGGNRTTCLMQSCFPYQCVDPVQRPGQCCPDCPNGRTCVLPMYVRRQLSALELQEIEPVAEFAPVVVFEGTASEMTCSCVGSLVTKCEKKNLPLANPIFRLRSWNMVA